TVDEPAQTPAPDATAIPATPRATSHPAEPAMPTATPAPTPAATPAAATNLPETTPAMAPPAAVPTPNVPTPDNRSGQAARVPFGARLDLSAREEAWVNTGIDLRAGDRVAIQVEGRIVYCSPGACDQTMVGPDGGGVECGDPGCGSVLASDGKSDPLFVGSSRAFIAAAAGPLRLRIVDYPGMYTDNHGSYAVTITVTPAS
ncbi:MAG: hypothetical protein ACR2J8_16220, partial [Thermomicrobiales bacterium]